MVEHEGELAVQRRAGVKAERWGSAGVGAAIPPVGADFLRRQHMLVLGAADDGGAVWATVLAGPEGFVEPVDERTVVVNAVPGPEDPLARLFEAGRDVGALAVEPPTRRRMRVNGRARRKGKRLVLRTEQVYSNCPKYIQTRHLRPDVPATRGDTGDRDVHAVHTREFTEEQQAWIAGADTFFVATHVDGLGADASHRGGNPGWVRPRGARRLTWPDYVGNGMYMTLGNLALNPACGLLFLDWEHGHTLHLTGRARVDWDPGRAAAVPGAQRMVDFDVERVVQVHHAIPLRWSFGDYFRLNPPVSA